MSKLSFRLLPSVGLGLSAGLLIAASLSGCADPSGTALQTELSSCGGAAVKGWIGQPVGAVTSQLPGVRILNPGSMNTMDYRPERLNVHVDGAGTITALTCG